MRAMLWGASGEAYVKDRPDPPPMEGTGFLDIIAAAGPIPDELPAWLTADDLAVYVDHFQTGDSSAP